MSRIIACFVLLFFTGCAETSSEDAAPLEAGDWTILEDQLQLEQDLHITETEDYFFGSIADVAADSEGRIYVADRRATNVKVLSPSGELLHTVGEQGEGPGEFGVVDQLQLTGGDSLYVYSARPKRVSVFSPEPPHPFVRSIPLPDAEGDAGEPRMIEGHGLIVRFADWPHAVDDPGEREMVIRRVGNDGNPEDALFVMPAAEIVMWPTARGQAGGPLPFGRSPHFEVGPDGHLHAAWSDSLSVARYTPSGDLNATLRIPFERVPVTGRDLDRTREEISSSHFEAAEDQIPDTKPAFDRFLIDDQGRYWFQRPTENPERSNWWIADPTGQTVYVVSKPSTVTLTAIRNGYAYGHTEGDNGEPTLVRYRVVE